jgi:hypothetical protein
LRCVFALKLHIIDYHQPLTHNEAEKVEKLLVFLDFFNNLVVLRKVFQSKVLHFIF